VGAGYFSVYKDGWTIGTRFLAGERNEFFSSPPPSISIPRPTQLPIQSVTRALSLRIKRPGREADHSPQSSSEVKNVWSYASIPPYGFMV
jgi:hypothetical protein